MPPSLLKLGGIILIAMTSLFLGQLLLIDPNIDIRVKLQHVTLKYVVYPMILNSVNDEFDRNTISKFAKSVAAGYEDGVHSVDVIIPPWNGSCYKDNKPAPVNARFYYRESVKTENVKAIVIYVHGGGFVLGRVTDPHIDRFARILTNNNNTFNNNNNNNNLMDYSVLSVDYRLAPENLIPEGIDDCISAVLHVHQNSDPLFKQYGSKNIILAGDSAGGFLVATVAQYLREKYPEVNIVHQILIYPVFHVTDTASRKKYADGYIIWTETVRAFDKACKPKTADFVNSTLYRPLNAKSLKGLPSSHIILADHDMLFDEGKLYYERLVADGVKAKLNVYENTVHGFFIFEYLQQTQQAWTDIKFELNQVLQLLK